MEKDFLGTGWSFPPKCDSLTGRIATVSGDDSVRQSIYIILKTNIGERITLPEFGSNISRYAFESMDLTTVSMMERDIRRVILENEPRVSDIVVDIKHDKKQYEKLLVNIYFMVVGSNVEKNMVFPFYLEGIGGELVE